jgi:hypothetical protein
MANFIDQNDKDSFQDCFDNLIDDIGQSIRIHFVEKQTSCPNCDWNRAEGRSANRYTTTNPNPLNGPLNKFFPTGTVCPVCRGVGKLNEPRNTTVIGTISKTAEEFEQISRELGRIPQNMIKVRTKLDTLQSIREATKIDIDGVVYKKLRPEIIQGLGEQMFIKTFWEQTNLGG